MNEITERQYALLHPYLPVQRGNVQVSNLTVINAMLFVAENGSASGTQCTLECAVGWMRAS